MDFNMISIIISFFSLLVSFFIGLRQVNISKTLADAQNKVEIYLETAPFTIKDSAHVLPDRVVPAVYIRNIGNNVIYLNEYCFNGNTYQLGKEVLPPVSSYNSYHYIFLPTDGTNHISLEIKFSDWRGNKWVTDGHADFSNGIWSVVHTPCQKVKKS